MVSLGLVIFERGFVSLVGLLPRGRPNWSSGPCVGIRLAVVLAIYVVVVKVVMDGVDFLKYDI